MPLANAAIDYYPVAFVTGGERLMGREAAGEGFLSGFLRHADVDRFYCFTGQQAEFEQFAAAGRAYRPNVPHTWLARREPASLAAVGCVYHPDPVLRNRAWERRHFDETAYSLCGVTHTICTAAVMDAVGSLATDPLYEWDALISTSTVVKSTIERILGNWLDYLAERIGTRPAAMIELPIIPLGVDCAAFDPPRPDSVRRELRTELGIDANDIVVLYLGRLVFHAKAHPLPMFLALERAARETGRPVTLVQAGWFPNTAIEAEIKACGQAACPSVKKIYVDGRRADYRRRIWHAADVFVSLADNIQETFGLSPVEAMAAGLPVVVSDWDGYRDTVRDGVDGFRIPTVMAPAGAGVEVALRYALGDDDYDRYIGTASLCAAVDVDRCAAAFARLFASESLRQTMGAAGRDHARSRFDWRHIVRAYQELWYELAQRRSRASRRTRRAGPGNPLREDPFSLFSTYPTAQLDGDSIVALTANTCQPRLEAVYRMPMMNFAATLLGSEDESRSLLSSLVKGPRSVDELLGSSDAERRRYLERTIVWLAKAGIVSIGRQDPRPTPAPNND